MSGEGNSKKVLRGVGGDCVAVIVMTELCGCDVFRDLMEMLMEGVFLGAKRSERTGNPYLQ